jgi:hypothetical protein
MGWTLVGNAFEALFFVLAIPAWIVFHAWPVLVVIVPYLVAACIFLFALHLVVRVLTVFAPLLRLVTRAVLYLWRACIGSVGALGRLALAKLGFKVQEKAKTYSSGSYHSGDDYGSGNGGPNPSDDTGPCGGGEDLDPDDPHYILGVSPGTSRTELKARYLKLVQMNHPDKVASLDPYLQQVATERTKRIIDAYNSLVAH